MTNWKALMDSLDRKPIPSRRRPTEKRVRAFEKHIGVELPADYRSFLLEHGGVWVNALAPIKEPTPCGQQATIESFYGFIAGKPKSTDLKWQCDLAEGAPVAIPIAGGAFGSQIFLFTSDQKLMGIKAGATCFWDCDNRSAWSDEMFHESFENLGPEIKHYLDLRRKGKLPEKPGGLEDFYRIADTFTVFLESCTRWDLDDDEE